MLKYKLISVLCLLDIYLLTVSTSDIINHDLERSGILSSCIYPVTPNNVTSYNSTVQNPVLGKAYDYIAINVTCQDGYGLDGDSFFSCYLGEWSPSANISQCVKPSCYLPRSASVEYHCLVPDVNGIRPCDEYESTGTVVKPQCRSPNYYSATDLHYMRCQNGRWDYIASCDPECGILTPEATQLMIGGQSAKRGEVPWHAGIYTKARKPFDQICGGSLISKNIVLSAAHCFWDGGNGRKLPVEQFAVAVGKLYRPWKESHDDAQKSDVKEIHLRPHYRGFGNYNPVDIAVVVVAKAFEYKNHIRPVCLDFSRIFQYRQLQPGVKGKVAGWGLMSENGPPSQVLKVLELPYVDINKCINEAPLIFQNYITQDKMCAGFKNEHKGLCMGDSGGGLSFPIQEKTTTRYYLRGIASTASNERNVQCDVNFYTTFTQVLDHEDFIKQFWVPDHASTSVNALVPNNDDMNIEKRLFQHLRFWIRKGNCVLPEYPAHGTYSTHIPNAEPGEAYEFVAIHVSCNEGYQVDSTDGSRDVYCFNGTWIPRPIPQCISADVQKPRTGNCILPPYPKHGTYETNVPKIPIRPGDAFEYIFMNVTCHQGYAMETGDRRREAYCYHGTWFPIEMPKCIRLCRLLPHPSVKYRCLVSGFEDSVSARDCKEYEPSGTTVSPICHSPHYYTLTDLPYMRCIEGSWDYVAKCLPECGTMTPEVSPLARENPGYNHVPIPWHAAIYTKTVTPYKLTCSGSVISHNTILTGLHLTAILSDGNATDDAAENEACLPSIYLFTLDLKTPKLYRSGNKDAAAHCFWSEFECKIQPANNYAVEVGKLHRLWGHSRDDSQQSDVKSIYIPSIYRGTINNFISDIALVIVISSFEFGLNVRPVCVDFHANFEKRQLHPGNMGKVASWQKANKSTADDDVLISFEMSYMDSMGCVEESPRTFLSYITSDKICAKYPEKGERYQLSIGESGTGLVFPNVYKGRLRYYLRGIASVAYQDEKRHRPNLVFFTNVLKHEHFIKQYWIGLVVPMVYPAPAENIDISTAVVPDSSRIKFPRNSGFIYKPVSCEMLGLSLCIYVFLNKI